MAILEWSSDFEVGVKQIDEQHQRLVHMINALHEAMVSRRAGVAINAIVGGMTDYAASHFAIEEKHMERFGYAGRDEHEAEHASFARKAAELQARLENGTLVLSLEVIEYLRDWLTNHILSTDKMLAAFLNEQGLH